CSTLESWVFPRRVGTATVRRKRKHPSTGLERGQGTKPKENDMLRRWIPILSVAAVVLATAEPASAALRDRWMNRRGGNSYSSAPVYYDGMQTVSYAPYSVPLT